MSGIAGIFNLSGAPAEPALLARMLMHIRHRGPDGSGQWIHGAVALGQQMLHTTPESLHERQPLTDEHEQVCLVMDGRVDHSEALRRAVEQAGFRLRDDTDAELVLKAYLAWGEACPAKILGDFAFAIWDERCRALFCARDFLGIKPFYYYCDGQKFLFGSELREVVDLPGVPRVPNEGMIGEYLADRITSRSETLYAGILRLPAAHALSVEAGRVRLHCYWSGDPGRTVRYATDREYADHFFELFEQAVRCRMRSHRPVSAELSGGVDSSSVVAMAHRLYRNGTVRQPVLPYSLVFPGLRCDETPFIQALLDHLEIQGHFIDPTQFDFHRYFEESSASLDLPAPPNQRMIEPLNLAVMESGSRVLLTGQGGDDWLTSDDGYLESLIRQGQIAAGFRLARQEKKSVGSLAKIGLRAWLPDRGYRALRRALGRDQLPGWISTDFARRVRLQERVFHAKPPEIVVHLDPYSQHTFEMVDRFNARFQLESRHPFHDRALVEFVCALPHEQLKRWHYEKFVLRKTMLGIVPDQVIRRLGKAEFSAMIIPALRIFKDGLFLDGPAARTGTEYLDRGRFKAALADSIRNYGVHEQAFFRTMWPVWMGVSVDLWSRAVWSLEP